MTNSNIQVPNTVNSQRLQAMELVAKMRAAADRVGAGFIGGFIDPNTGELFTMTNMHSFITPDTDPLLED